MNSSELRTATVTYNLLQGRGKTWAGTKRFAQSPVEREPGWAYVQRNDSLSINQILCLRREGACRATRITEMEEILDIYE